MRNGLIRCGVAHPLLQLSLSAFGHFPRIWFFLVSIGACGFLFSSVQHWIELVDEFALMNEWTDANFHRGIATLPMMLEQIHNEPDPFAFVHRINTRPRRSTTSWVKWSTRNGFIRKIKSRRNSKRLDDSVMRNLLWVCDGHRNAYQTRYQMKSLISI